MQVPQSGGHIAAISGEADGQQGCCSLSLSGRKMAGRGGAGWAYGVEGAARPLSKSETGEQKKRRDNSERAASSEQNEQKQEKKRESSLTT